MPLPTGINEEKEEKKALPVSQSSLRQELDKLIKFLGESNDNKYKILLDLLTKNPINHELNLPKGDEGTFLSNCQGLRSAWEEPLFPLICHRAAIDVADQITAVKGKRALGFDNLYQEVAKLRRSMAYAFHPSFESYGFGSFRGDLFMDRLLSFEKLNDKRYYDQIIYLAKLYFLCFPIIKNLPIPPGDNSDSEIVSEYNGEKLIKIQFCFEKKEGHEGQESIEIKQRLIRQSPGECLELCVMHLNNNELSNDENTPNYHYRHFLPEIEKLFEELKNMVGNINNLHDREEAYYKVGKIFWLLSLICPFKRGSASINDIICRGILKSILPDEPIYTFKPGISPDLAAMFCTDVDLFARNFIDFFDRSSFKQQYQRPSENKNLAEILIEAIIKKHAPDNLKSSLLDDLLNPKKQFVLGLPYHNEDEEKPEAKLILH